MLSGEAEDVLILKPDIVVAGLFTKRATRELLKPKGLRLPSSTWRARSMTPAGRSAMMGELPGSPSVPRPRTRGSMPRSCAREPRSRRGFRVLPLSRRGWVSGSDSFDLSLLAAGLFNAAGELGFAFGGFASLENRSSACGRTSCWFRRPAISPAMTARLFCCIRRWSGSIRRQNASSFRSA